MLNNHRQEIGICSPLWTVTNVLVNDPSQGYAVFGDIMIKEMRE